MANKYREREKSREYARVGENIGKKELDDVIYRILFTSV